MSSEYPYVRKIERKDGSITFSYISVDGIGMIPFPALLTEDSPHRFQAIRDLETKSDDIILATYPKSGTHWAGQITHMLMKGTTDYRPDGKGYLLEMIDDFDVVKNNESPRVLVTHLPYRCLPKNHAENGGKIVHVRRNPKDVNVSFFHFLKSIYQPGMDFWDKIRDMTWDQYFNNLVVSEDPMWGGWFLYEKDMELAKQGAAGRSIHTMSFEQLKQDPVSEIRKLADFLNVQYTNQFLQEIADKCSFSKLKASQKEIKETAENTEGEKPESTRKGMKLDVYRKGIIGDWKNTFTVAQNELFDALTKKEMEGCNLDIIYEA